MFWCKCNIWQGKIVENLQNERFQIIERDNIRYEDEANTTPSSVQNEF